MEAVRKRVLEKNKKKKEGLSDHLINLLCSKKWPLEPKQLIIYARPWICQFEQLFIMANLVHFAWSVCALLKLSLY